MRSNSRLDLVDLRLQIGDRVAHHVDDVTFEVHQVLQVAGRREDVSGDLVEGDDEDEQRSRAGHDVERAHDGDWEDVATISDWEEVATILLQVGARSPGSVGDGDASETARVSETPLARNNLLR